jgi:hypothetical protein
VKLISQTPASEETGAEVSTREHRGRSSKEHRGPVEAHGTPGVKGSSDSSFGTSTSRTGAMIWSHGSELLERGPRLR